MHLSDIQKSEWYLSRPLVIQQAIDILPPGRLYKFKDSGKQCKLHSYEEPESGLLEDVTVTVNKTGVGGAMASMGLGVLDTNSVFGVKLNDLEPWDEQVDEPITMKPLAPGWRKLMEQQSHSELTEDTLREFFMHILNVDVKHIQEHDSNETFEQIKNYLNEIKK